MTEEADSVFCPWSIHLEEGRRHIHFILGGSALENSCLSWGLSTGHFSQELKNCGHLNPTPAAQGLCYQQILRHSRRLIPSRRDLGPHWGEGGVLLGLRSHCSMGMTLLTLMEDLSTVAAANVQCRVWR